MAFAFQKEFWNHPIIQLINPDILNSFPERNRPIFAFQYYRFWPYAMQDLLERTQYIWIFVVLLLREKRWKDSLLSLLYSVLLYIIPSFFVGGLSVISKIFEKIPDYINQIQEGGAAYRTDIFAGLDILSMSLGYNPISNNSPVKYIIWAILVLSLIVCGFISKSKWKRALAITLIVIAGPFAELQTSLILLFVPLVLCLDSEDERKAMDMVHLFLFVVVMAPLAIMDCIINFEQNKGYELYLHSYNN